MAIFRTSRGESTAVGGVGSDIEHASIGSVPGNTIAPEVADAFGERCLTAAEGSASPKSANSVAKIQNAVRLIFP